MPSFRKKRLGANGAPYTSNRSGTQRSKGSDAAEGDVPAANSQPEEPAKKISKIE